MPPNPSKSFLLSVLLCIALAVMIILALAGLGGTAPELYRARGQRNAAAPIVPIEQIEDVFNATRDIGRQSVALNANPFFTRYFEPPPVTTRKVEVTYQGFYETSDGEARAFVKLGDSVRLVATGTNLISDFVITTIEPRRLVLTDGEQKTRALEFNKKAELTVPLK